MPLTLDRQLARLLELTRRGARLGLERMEEALALLDEPHAGLRVVHVAGTNGKGSTAAMVEAVARRAGLRTGLYTSPHLCRFNERIRLGGEPIADDAFAAALARALRRELPPLSLFETMTVAALCAFADAKVDVAVLEVGLGGRLDATNVVAEPLAAAVTSIGLDHQRFLGPDLPSIAREKAAIAKRGRPLVVGPLAPEAALAVEEVAVAAGAAPIAWIPPSPLPRPQPALAHDDDSSEIRFDDSVSFKLRPALAGAHQRVNAAIAAALVWHARTALPGIERHIEAGIAAARWPGRLERIPARHGDVLLDCAHNLEGIGTLRAYLERVPPPGPEARDPRRNILVFGAIDDKPHRAMLDAIAPIAARRHYCRPIDPMAGRQAVAPAELARAWPGEVHDRAEAALEAALAEADPGDLVVVTGSIFLVGAARAAMLGLPRHPPVPL